MTTSNEEEQVALRVYIDAVRRAPEKAFKINACDALSVYIDAVPVCALIVQYMIQPQSWNFTDPQVQEVATAVSTDVLVTKRPTPGTPGARSQWTWLRPTRPLLHGDTIAMLFDIPPGRNGELCALMVGDTCRSSDRVDLQCFEKSVAVLREHGVPRKIHDVPLPIEDLKRIEMRHDDDARLTTTLVFAGGHSSTHRLQMGDVSFPGVGINMFTVRSNPIGWRITIVNVPPL